MPESLSFIIPVHNEEESLPALMKEIEQVMASQTCQWQAILVDDGSTDGSWDSIQQHSQTHPHFQGIRFRKRFGKSAALAAGFAQATGDILVTIDGDLQDDPAEVPGLIEQLNHDKVDLVTGWKKTRHDPWHKVFPSRVFNWMVSVLTGVKLHDHNCGLKVMRKAVVQEVQLYGERHRFIPVLAASRGFKVAERVIQHRPRQFGRSKYGVSRFFKGFLDLLTVRFLTSYEHRPQHLLGIAGGLFAFLGLAGMGYLAWDWFQPGHTPLHQRPLLTYSVTSLLLGVQLFSMGLLAELITAQRRRPEDTYSIAERTPGNLP
ncbi:MAG: glycosyltransferase family 2 protein [Gemmatales bacterium]